MQEYSVSWLEVAREAYNSLPPSRRSAVDQQIDLLARQPTLGARQDRTSSWWTTTYGDGDGLLLYGISKCHRRVVILRLQDLS